MSDKETKAAAGMSTADADFLMACIRNLTEGSAINIDTTKVASECGFTNVKSVTNKISALKAKYNLPLKGAAGSGVIAPKVDGSPKKKPAVKGARVTKAKPAPKKAAGKAKKGVKKEEEDEVEMADAEDSEELAVKKPEPVSDDGALSGENSEDEEA